MQQLPTHWAVQIDKNNTDMIRWMNENGTTDDYSQWGGTFFHNPPFNGVCSWTTKRDSYTLLTTSEFETLVLNKGRKIVGYKAPFRINSMVSSGTTYVPHGNGYCPDGKQGAGSERYLPKEIVETWEPVFEEEKFKVGDWLFVISRECSIKGVGNGYIGKIKEIFPYGGGCGIKDAYRFEDGAECSAREGCTRLATPSEIVEATKPKLPKINGHEGKIEGDSVVYGCAKFDKDWFKDVATLNYDGNTRKVKAIVLDSNVTITIDEISQIVKAIESK